MALCHRLKFFPPKKKKKKNSELFFLYILSLTNAYDYVHHACLKSGRRNDIMDSSKLFFLFYFQSCCQIRLHWTRRTIRSTILDRITEDLEEEKMGLDSKQLNNTRDIKYFIILFFLNLNVRSYSYNYNTLFLSVPIIAYFFNNCKAVCVFRTFIIVSNYESPSIKKLRWQ